MTVKCALNLAHFCVNLFKQRLITGTCAAIEKWAASPRLTHFWLCLSETNPFSKNNGQV